MAGGVGGARRPSVGPAGPPSAPVTPKGVGTCPPGSQEVAMVTKPAPPGSPFPKQMACPDGAARTPRNTCCQKAAGAPFPGIGGLPGGGIGGGPGGAPGGGPPTPGNVERPGLNPLDPQAAYDPEIARSLAAQRQYEEELRQGSGHAMEALTTAQADQLEAQVAQARASADQYGLPFNEAAMRAQLMKGVNLAQEQGRQQRESALGGALQASAATAQGQAGERTQRLGIDLSRDVQENQQALQRYSEDISKYGIDVQAATAANNALLNYYAALQGNLFGMFGNMFSGLGNFGGISNQNYYG